MKSAFILFLGVAFVFVLAGSAGAVPSNGVWPDTFSSLLSTSSVEGPFAFSGGPVTTITVWYGNENNAFDPDVEVWIGCTEGGHTFGGQPLSFYSDGSPPNEVPSFWHTFGDNYALNLGSYNTPNSLLDGGTATWADVTTGPLKEGGGKFVAMELSWTGGLGAGQWIYAMTDHSGNGSIFDNGGDEFSPPTTSTVPEPATLLLLGAGLMGIGLVGRKKSS